MKKKPPARKITFNLPLPDAEALDAFCRDYRKITGDPVTYTDVIIRALTAYFTPVRDRYDVR